MKFHADRGLLTVFAVAFAFRIGFFVIAWFNNGLNYAIHFPDSEGYDQLTLNLLAGNGFSRQATPPYSPDLWRTPVYPLFLAIIYRIFGYEPFVAIFFQTIIGAFTCVLCVLLGRRVLKSDHAGYISGWILASYPLLVAYDNTLLTESLFTSMFAGGTYYFVKMLETVHTKTALMCGFLWGVATLCRPISIYLIPVLIIYLIVSRLFRQLRMRWQTLLWICVCVYVGFFIVVFPWMLRNRSLMGKNQVTLMTMDDVWMRGLSFIRALHSGLSSQEEYHKVMEEFESIAAHDTALINVAKWRFRWRSIREMMDAQPPYWKLYAWGILSTLFIQHTSDIGAMLGVERGPQFNLLNGFADMGLRKLLASVYWQKTTWECFYLILLTIYSAILYALALYCILRWRRSPVVLGLCLIIFYLILAPGFVGDGRYRIPAMPFVATLSSWSILAIFKKTSPTD